jgi:hypothetical protein
MSHFCAFQKARAKSLVVGNSAVFYAYAHLRDARINQWAAGKGVRAWLSRTKYDEKLLKIQSLTEHRVVHKELREIAILFEEGIVVRIRRHACAAQSVSYGLEFRVGREERRNELETATLERPRQVSVVREELAHSSLAVTKQDRQRFRVNVLRHLLYCEDGIRNEVKRSEEAFNHSRVVLGENVHVVTFSISEAIGDIEGEEAHAARHRSVFVYQLDVRAHSGLDKTGNGRLRNRRMTGG